MKATAKGATAKRATVKGATVRAAAVKGGASKAADDQAAASKAAVVKEAGRGAAVDATAAGKRAATTQPVNTLSAGPCCATALRKASRRLTQLYDNALMPSGLRSTQYAILAEVGRRSESPPTVQELANALVLDRSALGHNLRPLERDGLMAFTGNATDRRRRHVVLTRKGAAKLRDTRALWQVAQDRFLAAFGDEAAASLRKTLLRIAHDESLVPQD